MNLIRLIKLKRISGELDTLNEKEIFFLNIFDKLYEEYDSVWKIRYYFSKKVDDYIFEYHEDDKKWWFSSQNFFYLFHERFGSSPDDIRKLIYDVLTKHLNYPMDLKVDMA